MPTDQCKVVATYERVQQKYSHNCCCCWWTSAASEKVLRVVNVRTRIEAYYLGVQLQYLEVRAV